jgi:hypothetical protein
VPLEASVSFWVVPWRIIAFVVVVGGLALVGLLTSGRNIYKKFKKNHKDAS